MTEMVKAESQEIEASGNLFGTHDPAVTIERATKVADALKDMLKKQGLIQRIQGREYIRVEGWTALGSMLGVSPRVAWSKPVENGWEARVEVVKADGTVIAAAEAQCTRSESTWKSRDDFAIRSMAQTRAMGKALRMPLGFIAVLAGYEATPAEEMPGPEAQHRTAQPPVTLKTLTTLQEALEATGSDLWTEEVVLANASRRFGRQINRLEYLTEGEAGTILAGAQAWLRKKETEVIEELQETLDAELVDE